MRQPPKIELFWFDGCSNHGQARELLAAVMTERGIDGGIEEIEVADDATGARVRFPGSPTIRVNGVDIEAGYVDSGDHTPRCRVYATAEGLRGVPERAWIETALEGVA